MNNKFYHLISRLGSSTFAAVLFAATFSGGALTACSDDDARPESLDGLIVLAPTVSLPGDGHLNGSFSAQTRAGNDAPGGAQAIFGLTLDALDDGSKGYASKLNSTQGSAIAHTVGSGTQVEGFIHVPCAGSYDLKLTDYNTALTAVRDASPGQTFTDKTGVPAAAHIHSTLPITMIDGTQTFDMHYLAPVGFVANGDVSHTTNVEVGASGSFSLRLDIASAGILLKMRLPNVSGMSVSVKVPYAADLAAATANGLHTVQAFTAFNGFGPGQNQPHSTYEEGCYNAYFYGISPLADGTSPGYSLMSAIIPASYSAGAKLCDIVLSDYPTVGSTRTLPLNLPVGTALDAKPGQLYTYNVLVDAVKATITSVEIAGFDSQSETTISKGGEDYVLTPAAERPGYDAINPLPDLYTVYTAKGLHDVAAIVNNNNLSADITLGANIDMSEVKDESNATNTKPFIGIGTTTAAYTGTFNGNGMIIKNLTMEGADPALVVTLGVGGSVVNITLVGGNVTNSVGTDNSNN